MQKTFCESTLGRAFAGIGWIAAGLVLAMLMLKINRPARNLNPGNVVDQETGAAALEASGTLADNADLLANFAQDPDFIDQAAFKAIKEHPSVFLVDIRTPREWKGGRIPGAVLVPLQELRDRLDEVPRDRHVILYCRTANRTRQGLRILRNAGYPTVRHLRGGIHVWDGPIETDTASGKL